MRENRRKKMTTQRRLPIPVIECKIEERNGEKKEKEVTLIRQTYKQMIDKQTDRQIYR